MRQAKSMVAQLHVEGAHLVKLHMSCHHAGHLDDCLEAKVCAIPQRKLSAVGTSDAPPSLWRPAERIHRGPVLQKGSVVVRALRHAGVQRMTSPALERSNSSTRVSPFKEMSIFTEVDLSAIGGGFPLRFW